MACQLEIECPSCQAPRPYPDPVPAGSGRVITRLVVCECGGLLRFKAVEGWERWYAVDFMNSDAAGMPIGVAICLRDRDAFYARFKAMGSARS